MLMRLITTGLQAAAPRRSDQVKAHCTYPVLPEAFAPQHP
jgi:hypothetical protein